MICRSFIYQLIMLLNKYLLFSSAYFSKCLGNGTLIAIEMQNILDNLIRNIAILAIIFSSSRLLLKSGESGNKSIKYYIFNILMGLQWYRRWRYFSSKRLFSISFLTEDRVKVIIFQLSIRPSTEHLIYYFTNSN